MSDPIAVKVTPDRLALPPGGRALITLTITNQGGVVDQFGLLVEGLDPSWYALRAPTVSLFPAASGELEMEVQLPEGPSIAAGLQRVQLVVVSRDDPGNTARVELPLEVLSLGALEMELTPRRVTSRGTGRFRLQLVNRSNAEQTVDLAFSDPAEAIEARLNTDRVAVQPGASEQVQLALRPRRRPLVAPPEHHTFTVTAMRAGMDASEPIATVEGELVYRAPFFFLAALSPRARALLLGLAGLAIAALLAVWFLAAPGTRGLFVSPASTSPSVEPSAAGQPTASPSVQPTEPADAGGSRPEIVKFDLTVPTNPKRGEFELSWEVRGAKEVLVDGKKQPASGTLRVETLVDREYEIEARGEADVSEKKSIGVVIIRPPEIIAFRASPEAVPLGQPSTLSWEVKRADRAGLDGQAVDTSKGTLSVRPEEDTTYTLTVENELGRVERQVTVRVIQPTPTP